MATSLDLCPTVLNEQKRGTAGLTVGSMDPCWSHLTPLLPLLLTHLHEVLNSNYNGIYLKVGEENSPGKSRMIDVDNIYAFPT